MADGFLGRWSRRKLDASEGKPLEEPPPPVPLAPAAETGETAATALATPAPVLVAAPELPPTLEDVQQLTPQSDFTRFVARGVTPEVKNAALKKLFTDPHYNVMDGLDTYIDDYTKSDPIPESMLRGMASAKFLGLFREEEPQADAAAGAGAGTEGLPAETVAQSDAPPDPQRAPDVPDADPDLRLQQDDAAEGGEPGRGAG